MRYWALQDAGDRKPYAVIALDDDGLPRRFVPGMGLVDWPAAAMWTHNGEPGAHVISPALASALMKSGIGPVSAAIVASQRGTAPTLPVPGVAVVPPAGTKHYVAGPRTPVTRADAEAMADQLFDAIVTERAQTARRNPGG